MTSIKMKYLFIGLLLLVSNCKSSIPNATSSSKINPSKWTNWKIPSPPKIDLNKDIVDTLATTQHFFFITHNTVLPKTTIQQIADQCEQTFQDIRQFVNSDQSIPKIGYHIYPTIEQKGLRLKVMDLAHLDESGSNNHIVWNQYFKGAQFHRENRILLRQLLDQPQLLALEEGLSNRFTKKWQQKGYEYWCKVLYQSNNLPPLKELLDNGIFEKESEIVMGAMAGVFVDFLIDHIGKEKFVDTYKTISQNDLLALEAEWNIYLQKRFDSNEQSKRLTSNEPLTSYLKGFNFAHEGYRIYNGYGSQLAKQSLDRLQQIGTNAIAIVPYSFMRNPNVPRPLLIDHRAGGENDESVLFSHYEAKIMGMHTMLKPQIWLRNSWPGDIKMNSEREWNTFFDYYYRWMRHYALLAEINGFDSLCLGVEFAKATLAKEQEWRQLIHQIRGIYSGPITYAANWGDEFEQLKFWDALDFIGLNCYYPLSKEKQVSKRTLKKSFTSVMNKIEKVSKQYNKPIVFTEIGFRSVEKTWANPHESTNGRAFNEQNQSLAYEVIFECIEDKDWCKGILWWKWPSYLEYGGAENTGFAPAGKEAETVVKEWFSK